MAFESVNSAFLASPPLLSQSIKDLTVISPSWMRDLPEIQEFPRGNGTTWTDIIYRGTLPQIERGFEQWKSLENNAGCDPCEGPNCGYNWTTVGGHGLQRKEALLMERDYKSDAYCIDAIQTTAHFMQVFDQIVKNLYRSTDFIIEQNIVFNALTSLLKKYVVDSGGPKPNPQNPYVYRPVTGTTLSTLNIQLLEFFYEYMRRIPDVVPYDLVNGQPIFSLMASHQLLAHLYRDDPNLRQDVRFSGMANDNLMKYNFMSTIRGMFISAPILYPRRFNADVNGNLVEVLPFVNGIPADAGSYTGFNPAYEAAIYEEVILNGRYPFKLIHMPKEETLGSNTSFGPEFSLLNNWIWVNPLTVQDPFRRVGFFATSATVGISQQFSDGMFGIVVTRPSILTTAVFNPAAVCPPDPVDCENVVPDVGCPCPIILDVSSNPITEGNFFITLAVPLDADPEDVAQFGVDTGGYITGTIAAVSTDGKTVETTFTGVDETQITNCRLTSIFCDNTLGCSSSVMSYAANCADDTHVNLILTNPIKAVTAGQSITIFYGDGSSATVTVVSADMLTNTWVVDVGATDFCDQVGGVLSVCVPTETDETCPACGGPTFTQCES
jgi:hypothetical protein